jgi:hypothetical protein
MWFWHHVVKPILEWVSHYESVQAILHTEFYKHWVAPLVSGVVTAWLGISEGVPLMWVAVGTSLVIAAVVQTRLRADEWRERRNPLNKIICIGVRVTPQLVPKPLPLAGNRSQRRASRGQQQMPIVLASNQIAYGIEREIAKLQVTCDVKNNATFPVSIILHNAETEIDGEKPPRTKFPKEPSTMQPGEVAMVPDEAIDMDGASCQPLNGKMDMLIKYGMRGDERFELRLTADLQIAMDRFGFISAVLAAWKG